MSQELNMSSDNLKKEKSLVDEYGELRVGHLILKLSELDDRIRRIEGMNINDRLEIAGAHKAGLDDRLSAHREWTETSIAVMEKLIQESHSRINEISNKFEVHNHLLGQRVEKIEPSEENLENTADDGLPIPDGLPTVLTNDEIKEIKSDLQWTEDTHGEDIGQLCRNLVDKAYVCGFRNAVNGINARNKRVSETRKSLTDAEQASLKTNQAWLKELNETLENDEKRKAAIRELMNKDGNDDRISTVGFDPGAEEGDQSAIVHLESKFKLGDEVNFYPYTDQNPLEFYPGTIVESERNGWYGVKPDKRIRDSNGNWTDQGDFLVPRHRIVPREQSSEE